MSIPVNKIVNVTITSTPTFPARKGFGLLNIMGDSDRFDPGELYRFYSDMDGVAEDFLPADPEYIAANIFFSQNPRPSELMISFRGTAVGGTHGRRIGVTDHDDMTLINDMPPSTLNITVDGAPHVITDISFASATDYASTAAILSAALVSASAGATAAYVTDHFEIISDTFGPTSTVVITAPEGGNVATTLGLLTSQGATSVAGSGSVQDVFGALDNLQAQSTAWYGLALVWDGVTDQELRDASQWCEARVKVFSYSLDNSTGVLTANDTTNLGYEFKNLARRRTLGVYHETPATYFPHVSALARMFTVNFNGTNTTATMKFKQLPGVPPSQITETQRQSLLGKNVNYHTEFGESAMIAEGVMADGTFFDEVHGLDWLQNAIETNAFGYLYTRTTKVPQTDKGTAAVVQQVEKAFAEGVRNGLLAPGTWNGQPLGEIDTGDLLPKGFYVYVQPVAEQNQSDRERRQAPPIQAIAKGAGAIHGLDIGVTFER